MNYKKSDVALMFAILSGIVASLAIFAYYPTDSLVVSVIASSVVFALTVAVELMLWIVLFVWSKARQFEKSMENYEELFGSGSELDPWSDEEIEEFMNNFEINEKQ